jgi:hypothetical protein
MVAAAVAVPAQGKAPAPVAARKFRAGVQKHVEQFASQTFTPSSASQPFSFDVPAYGFLRGIYLMVDVTGGVGSGTPAAYRGDAPFSWLQTVQVLDVNSAPIVFQVTGYDLYLYAKYGGYSAAGDAKASPSYTQGGTGGNASFILRIPLEIRSRDGVGALPNKNNAAAYRVTGSIAPTTDVFSTAPAPTAPTTLLLRAMMDAWWEPAATDLKGRPQAQEPPASNTTQFLSKQVFGTLSGTNTYKLSRVGYLVRTLIFVQRDNSSPAVRSSAVFPESLTIIYEGQNLTLLNRALLQHQMQQEFGYVNAVDTAGGLDTGVFVFSFANDFGHAVGNELSTAYLPTTTATRLELQGSSSAAGTLTVLTNDISARDELEIAAG